MEKAQLCNFFMGVGIGVAAALLFAPRDGKRTRSRITEAAADGTTYLRKRGETIRDATFDLAKKRKNEIGRQLTRQKEGLAEALKRCSEVYRRVAS